MVQDFIIGENLECGGKRIHDKDVWEKVAEEMARWHSKSVYEKALNFDIKPAYSFATPLKSYPYQFQSMEHMKPLLKYFPTREEVLFEHEDMIKRLSESGDFEWAFCQLDIKADNIIITPEVTDSGAVDGEKSRAVFVDGEFVGLHSTQFDVMWHFSTDLALNESGDICLPSDEYQKEFIAHYLLHRKLQEIYSKDMEAKPKVTKTEVEKYFRQVQKMKLFAKLRFIMGGLFIYAFSKDDQFIECGKKFWREFQTEKRELFSEL